MARRDLTGPVIAQCVNRRSEQASSSTDTFESKSRTFFGSYKKLYVTKNKL